MIGAYEHPGARFNRLHRNLDKDEISEPARQPNPARFARAGHDDAGLTVTAETDRLVCSQTHRAEQRFRFVVRPRLRNHTAIATLELRERYDPSGCGFGLSRQA